MILIMEKGRYGEAYNIGNPANKLKVSELAKLVKKIMKSKSEIRFVDPKKIFGEDYEEANDKFPEISKARAELGFNPTRGVEETIREARDEYLRQLKKGVLKGKV